MANTELTKNFSCLFRVLFGVCPVKAVRIKSNNLKTLKTFKGRKTFWDVFPLARLFVFSFKALLKPHKSFKTNQIPKLKPPYLQIIIFMAFWGVIGIYLLHRWFLKGILSFPHIKYFYGNFLIHALYPVGIWFLAITLLLFVNKLFKKRKSPHQIEIIAFHLWFIPAIAFVFNIAHPLFDIPIPKFSVSWMGYRIITLERFFIYLWLPVTLFFVFKDFFKFPHKKRNLVLMGFSSISVPLFAYFVVKASVFHAYKVLIILNIHDIHPHMFNILGLELLVFIFLLVIISRFFLLHRISLKAFCTYLTLNFLLTLVLGGALFFSSFLLNTLFPHIYLPPKVTTGDFGRGFSQETSSFVWSSSTDYEQCDELGQPCPTLSAEPEYANKDKYYLYDNVLDLDFDLAQAEITEIRCIINFTDPYNDSYVDSRPWASCDFTPAGGSQTICPGPGTYINSIGSKTLHMNSSTTSCFSDLVNSLLQDDNDINVHLSVYGNVYEGEYKADEITYDSVKIEMDYYFPGHFYVDGVNGNDANDCNSSSTACKTIQKAVDKITPGAGDIVKIRGTWEGSQIDYSRGIYVTTDINGKSIDEPTIFENWDGDLYKPKIWPVVLPETWSPTNNTDVDTPVARSNHTAVWAPELGTRGKMIVWGGQGTGGLCGTNFSSGAIYDPADDSWEPMASGLNGYSNHTAVWTGQEMIIRGGRWSFWDSGIGGCNTRLSNFRSIYKPATNSWSETVVSLRADHTAVWAPELGTRGKMIVWGGYNGSTYLNTGEIYDPATGGTTSITIPIAARSSHTAVWTGSKMIIWGGYDNSPLYVNTGAIYDPITNETISISTDGAPYGRSRHTTIWTGSKMIVWGGYGCTSAPTCSSGSLLDTGGMWRPNGIEGCADPEGCWEQIPSEGAPSARYNHTAVWAPEAGIDGIMIIWGGYSPFQYLNTGAIFDPNEDTQGKWIKSTEIPPAEIPGRYSHSAVWTGTGEAPLGCSPDQPEMIVWGGQASSGFTNTGGLYRPCPVGASITISNSANDISFITFRNLEVTNCRSSILLEAPSNTISGITISDNVLGENFEHGIIIKAAAIGTASAGIRVEGNDIYSNGTTAILLDAPTITQVGISGNNIYSNETGINFVGTSTIGTASAGIRIEGNDIYSNDVTAILLEAPAITQVGILGNHIYSNKIGINLIGTSSGVNGVSIANNTIRDHTNGNAIYINNTASTTQHVTVFRNTILNNGTSGNTNSAVAIGGLAGIGRNLVFSNLIAANRGSPISGNAWTHIFGNIIHHNNSNVNASNAAFVYNTLRNTKTPTAGISRNNITSFSSSWGTPDDANFSIVASRDELYWLDTGTADSSSTNISIDDTSKTWLDGELIGKAVYVFKEGTGCGIGTNSSATIIDNTPTSLSLYPSLAGGSAANCTYKITDFTFVNRSDQPWTLPFGPATPLGNGAASGNGIWGDADDAKSLTTIDDISYGIVNIGAKQGFLINPNTAADDDQILSNALQLAHDDPSVSALDTIETFSLVEQSGNLVSSGAVATAQADGQRILLDIATAPEVITTNYQYVGSFLKTVLGANSGKAYPILNTLNGTPDQIMILAPPSDISGFANGDEFQIIDRIYDEAFKTTSPTAQTTLSKKGNPGWPIKFQAKTWDATSSDWSLSPAVILDAQGKDHNIYSENAKCIEFKDFSYMGAKTSSFGGASITCIPYSYLELNSKTYDTGVHGGVAYNSILWFGSPPPGLPEYDSNSHAKYLKMQLAASDCPNGYSGSKGEADYDQKCQDMTQDYWGREYDPGNNQYGSPFYGDDTEEGINCAESSYYYPDPDEITPIKGDCFNNLYNKRYFKYKLILNYYDLDKNGYPSEGDTTAKIDEIIINYSR